MDVKDPRFAAVYTSHHYAIDPTSSKFKKTKAMQELLNERRRRNKVGRRGSVTAYCLIRFGRQCLRSIVVVMSGTDWGRPSILTRTLCLTTAE